MFYEFLDEPERFSVMKELRSGRFRRLFILKAFTKLYAMAGLRLGYGLCSDSGLLERLQAVRQPWSVSGRPSAPAWRPLERRILRSAPERCLKGSGRGFLQPP